MRKTLHQVLKEVERSVGESFPQSIDSVHTERFGGETALHIVSKWGDAEAIDILVSAGADVNKTGEDDNTPLHYAAMLGNFDAAKRLVESGARCMKDIYGNTPAQLAYKYPAIQKYLEQHGF